MEVHRDSFLRHIRRDKSSPTAAAKRSLLPGPHKQCDLPTHHAMIRYNNLYVVTPSGPLRTPARPGHPRYPGRRRRCAASDALTRQVRAYKPRKGVPVSLFNLIVAELVIGLGKKALEAIEEELSGDDD